MCGIFGILLQDKTPWSVDDFDEDLRRLYALSERRGQDATGLALASSDGIEILRRGGNPRRMLADPAISELIEKRFARSRAGLCGIGHCRLVTNGSMAVEDNNQPIHSGRVVGVHNGIIINTDALKPASANGGTDLPSASFTAEGGLVESDTKILFANINENLGVAGAPATAVSKTFSALEGSASIAAFCDNDSLILATNTGSLYSIFAHNGVFVFASERSFLKDFLVDSRLLEGADAPEIRQVKAGTGLVIPFKLSHPVPFSFDRPHEAQGRAAGGSAAKSFQVRNIRSDIATLKRCAKCILPHTYPFISFDDKGVCNYCEKYKKQIPLGEEKLEQLLSKHRSRDGSPDCLVGLSGGRDSSYGMHILKTKFRMNPIAYTYDWGLTTDVSRRNQANVVGKLGIEHIIRAPEIPAKRRYVRKNIHAWLKSPHLGMVPLFMAGDKDFYHYGRQLRDELELELTVFCAGQQLEQREFMVGFCGINEHLQDNQRLYSYSLFTKFRLALFYSLQYLGNPAYINESLYDSVRSFLVSFIGRDDFLYLYSYLPWDEAEIERVLKAEYDWEKDKGYGKNQWRMGDGQTAFTNYIYYTVAGFSEFDQFRSNQVREGMITRKEALELAVLDNRPKFETLQYFGHVIGINLEEVLREINAIPKLY